MGTSGLSRPSRPFSRPEEGDCESTRRQVALDEPSWEFHRRRGDYSRWIGLAIKDADLAREIRAIEQAASSPAEARDAVRAAIERRYTLPA